MNPEVETLKIEMQKLKSAFAIPIDIERAFKARLGGLYAAQNTTGTYTTSGLERTISLSGDPQDIKVLKYPDGYIVIQFGASTYKIPFFTD